MSTSSVNRSRATCPASRMRLTLELLASSMSDHKRLV